MGWTAPPYRSRLTLEFSSQPLPGTENTVTVAARNQVLSEAEAGQEGDWGVRRMPDKLEKNYLRSEDCAIIFAAGRVDLKGGVFRFNLG